ncbi:MAG TPA: hypothetical protein VMX36_04825, partial [Sedimentisphaerales bacterium]|nr:hypothetical protein [Sedimentisphaerales bacterium]
RLFLANRSSLMSLVCTDTALFLKSHLWISSKTRAILLIHLVCYHRIDQNSIYRSYSPSSRYIRKHRPYQRPLTANKRRKATNASN